MKILITGTAGFIGYHLVGRLIEEDLEIVGLDIINDYYDLNLKYDRLLNHGIRKEKIEYNKFVQSEKYSNYRFIKLDLTDREGIANLFKTEKFDYVVNLAAQAGVRHSLTHPHDYVDFNITGFLNILEGCRHNKVKHLVYASSSSVYGGNKKSPFSVEHNVDHPLSIYAASKKANELMAHSYSSLYNIPTTGLRFFSVYGTWGRPDMAMFIFTRKILADQPIEIYNEGKMIRDFTYIDDITEGIYKVLNRIPKALENWSDEDGIARSFAPYSLYNIGNNDPVELMYFIKEIEKNLGKEAEKIYLPMQPGDVPASNADVKNLIEDVGYKPSTSIEYGINQFINWYLDYYGEK